MTFHEDAEFNQHLTIEPLKFWLGGAIDSAAEESVHILKDRLVAGEVTACYGPPKSGKTFVAVTCAFAAALDQEFWGQQFSNNGASVIYVAAERYRQVAKRFRAMAKHLGLPGIPENLILVNGKSHLGLSSIARQEQLAQFIGKFNPALVIFDTYARLIDNNEDSARDATDNITAIENIIDASARPCAAIVIHHSGKDGSKGMRGSSAILASVTTAWRVSSKSGNTCLSLDAANDFDECKPQYFRILTVYLPRPLRIDVIDEVGVAIPSSVPSAAQNRRQDVLETWKGSEGVWRSALEVRFILHEGGISIGESTLGKILKELADSGLLQRRREVKTYEFRLPTSEAPMSVAA